MKVSLSLQPADFGGSGSWAGPDGSAYQAARPAQAALPSIAPSAYNARDGGTTAHIDANYLPGALIPGAAGQRVRPRTDQTETSDEGRPR